MKRLNGYKMIALAAVLLGASLPGSSAFAMPPAPSGELQQKYENIHTERESLEAKIAEDKKHLPQLHRALEQLRVRPIANRARIQKMSDDLIQLAADLKSERDRDSVLVDAELSLAEQLHIAYPYNLDPNKAASIGAPLQVNNPEASARPFLRRTATGSMLAISHGPITVDGSTAK